MKIGGGRRNMRALDVTVSVDHGGGDVVVNGQPAGPGVTIAGEAPPLVPANWWPWILGAAALGVVWWLVKDDAEKEGAGVPGPFVG
jgi:hypothetical protein